MKLIYGTSNSINIQLVIAGCVVKDETIYLVIGGM